MREQNVLANQSLVKDGSFRQLLTHWTEYPKGSTWVRVVGQDYDGLPVNTLSVGYEASARQSFVVPMDPAVDAVYVLKFLCESRHTGTGFVRIDSEGTTLLEIPIPPGRQRNAGQPLAFKPVLYEVALDSKFSKGATLTFSVTSAPSEPDDYELLLYITDITIELLLQPLVLQAFSLDEESHPPTALVPLCLGAEDLGIHQLKFDVADGNSWQGSDYSLEVDANPQGAIVPYPDWSVDHPLEERRSLRCPPLDLTAPHLMTLTLFNQYTAEPYRLAASLWHHRLKFLQVQEAPYFPVLEYNESVELGVQVGSFYTGQTLEGLTVTWTVTGTSIQAVTVTDAGGWVYFPFNPDVAGIFTVVASVESLYYASGAVTQSLEVQVLETDPWREVMAVVADEATPWASKTGWPNRGSTYQLLVTVPDVLVGTTLSLGWDGDSQEQLDVGVSPAIKEEVSITPTLQMLWTMINGDKLDGRFRLQLICSKLLKPSPHKNMRLARNEIEIGRVREADKTCVVDENESATVQVEVLHLVADGGGDPVQGALAKWLLPGGGTVDSITGAGGWTSLTWQPTSAGNHSVVVQIQAHPDAIPVEWTFVIPAVATSPWKSHVRVFLDNVEVERKTLGLLCRRGQTHTLKVLPNTASPWIGKNISLHWRKADPLIGLTISELGSPKTLLPEGVEWTLSSQAGTSQSRPFEVELHIDGESSVRELSGRLMHPDLKEELSQLLDQVFAQLTGQPFHPCLGALHQFNALPNALSPLLGLDLFLEWTGTSAAELGATVTPALDRPQRLDAGGAIWALDFLSAVAGQFMLTLSLPQLGFAFTATPMVLDHNKLRLMELRGPAIDPVVGMDKAWIWARVVSHFSGEPVAGATVTWEAGDTTVEVKTDDEGKSGFAYEPKSSGVHPVTGSIISRFDNFQESRSTECNALEVDPWEQMLSAFDESPQHRLGTKTCFPRRNAEHVLEVAAPVGNALIGRTLTLGMSGDGPDELGIAFKPDNTLGLARVFNGTLQFPFSVKDRKDGSFALRLAAERLGRLSPSMNMSVGKGDQVLTISAANRAAPAIYWGEAFAGVVRVLSSISGKAMVGVEVNCSGENGVTFTTVTDFYGNANVGFVPKVPGPSAVICSVGTGATSQSVALPYELLEPREIASLTSPNTSGPVGTKVSAEILVVSARNGQPLQNVEVKWAFRDLDLQPSRTDGVGKAKVEFRLPGMNRALLEATVEGGFAGWAGKYLEFRMVPNV
ncbi:MULTISPECIES: Ig-like domain-containing protein [Pseudomonas fluorescens group]|uniref:Ig-like domain-containing protein n=1 Tax=Pseudomonas fluorescens group TaxID=136843 RepID=UPI00068F3F15|nr:MULTISPECIES: Ig-like domain-containing protein [Pseudomonas fluorescens group]MBP4001210.1 Ig-like domain-containing protein [Pseudomonas koreensis]